MATRIVKVERQVDDIDLKLDKLLNMYAIDMKILIEKVSSNNSIYYVDNNNNQNNEHQKLFKNEYKKTKSILQQKPSVDNNPPVFRNYFANRANSLTDTKQIKSVSYSFNKQNLSDMLLVTEGKYENDSNDRESFVKSTNSFTNFGDDVDLDEEENEPDDEQELYYEYEYEEEITQMNNNNISENQLIKFRLPSALKQDDSSPKDNSKHNRNLKKKIKKNSYMRKYFINSLIQNNLKNLTRSEIKLLKNEKFKSDSQLFSNQNSNLNVFLTKTSNAIVKHQTQKITNSNINDSVSASSNTNMLINVIDLISKSELVNLNKIESNKNTNNYNSGLTPSTNSAKLDFSELRNLPLKKKHHLVKQATSTSDSSKVSSKLESSPIKISNDNQKDDSNLSVNAKKGNDKSCSIQLIGDE